jgi:hypothetical protein
MISVIALAGVSGGHFSPFSLPGEGLGMRVRSLARGAFLNHVRVYPRQGCVKGGSSLGPHPKPSPNWRGSKSGQESVPQSQGSQDKRTAELLNLRNLLRSAASGSPGCFLCGNTALALETSSHWPFNLIAVSGFQSAGSLNSSKIAKGARPVARSRQIGKGK